MVKQNISESKILISNLEILINNASNQTLSSIIYDLSSNNLIKIIKPNHILYKKFLKFFKNSSIEKTKKFADSLANEALSNDILKEVIIWTWFNENAEFYKLITYILEILYKPDLEKADIIPQCSHDLINSKVPQENFLPKLQIISQLLFDYANSLRLNLQNSSSQLSENSNTNNHENVVNRNISFIIEQLNNIVTEYKTSQSSKDERGNKQEQTSSNTSDIQLDSEKKSLDTSNTSMVQNNSNLHQNLLRNYEHILEENKELRQRIKQLEKERNALNSKITEIQNELNTLKNTLNEVQLLNAKLQRENVQLSKDLDQQKQILKSKNQSIREISDTENLKMNEDKQFLELSNKVALLYSEISNLEKQIKSKNKKIADLTDQINKLSIENKRFFERTKILVELQKKNEIILDKLIMFQNASLGKVITCFKNCYIESLNKVTKAYLVEIVGNNFLCIPENKFHPKKPIENEFVLICYKDSKSKYSNTTDLNTTDLVYDHTRDSINIVHKQNNVQKNVNSDNINEIDNENHQNISLPSNNVKFCKIDYANMENVEIVWVLETQKRQEIIGILTKDNNNKYYLQTYDDNSDLISVKIDVNTELDYINNKNSINLLNTNNYSNFASYPVVGIFLPAFETREAGIYKIRFLQSEDKKESKDNFYSNCFATISAIERYYGLISLPKNIEIFKQILLENGINFTLVSRKDKYKSDGILFTSDYRSILAWLKPKLKMLPICRSNECFEKIKRVDESNINTRCRNEIIPNYNDHELQGNYDCSNANATIYSDSSSTVDGLISNTSSKASFDSNLALFRYAKDNEICSVCGKSVKSQIVEQESSKYLQNNENKFYESLDFQHKKILIVGGDSIGSKYTEIFAKYNLYVDWHSGFKSLTNLKNSSFLYDLVIVITSQISHTTIRELYKALGKTSVPVIFSCSSGTSSVIRQIYNYFCTQKMLKK